MDLAQELENRGLVEHTGGGTLEEVLKESRKVYLGIDPTADSLHVGNMVSVILMKHLHEAGHEPYFLVGGGTGLIGDPKPNVERTLLDEETVAKNKESIRKQMSSILEKKDLVVEDNARWLTKLPLITFLRDIGKHFSVNQLIKRDIIKRRLETDEESISYTEFSYSLLQAYDFMFLNEEYGIDLQIGGSDQWANIISGIDLIRRKQQKSAFALTTPMVIDKSTGKKFGKSEGNAVWLDPEKTTPFAFYQFWLNTTDENVADYLKLFTFLTPEQCEKILEEHANAPEKREAQKTLAREVTTFVHGKDVAEAVEYVSSVLYAKDFSLSYLTETQRDVLLQAAPVTEITSDELSDTTVVEALLKTELCSSKADARRMLESQAVSINGETKSEDQQLNTNLFVENLLLLKRGKKVVLLELV